MKHHFFLNIAFSAVLCGNVKFGKGCFVGAKIVLTLDIHW